MLEHVQKWKPLPFLFVLILVLNSVIALGVIQVSTREIQMSVAPGGNLNRSFSVSNTGNGKEEVAIDIKDWKLDQQGERLIYEPGTQPSSLAAWITVSPREFSLAPGETREVNVAISMPEEERGTHWSMLIVKGSPVTEERQGNFIVRISAGYPVNLIQLDPQNNDKTGQISSVELNRPQGADGKYSIDVGFVNTGETPLNPEGYIEIRDQTGETVYKTEIERFFVLPTGTRVMHIPIENELNPGSYAILAVIDFEGDYLAAGQRLFEITGQ